MKGKIAKVVAPDGTVWAEAPDETWNLRGEPWPEVGELVEVCFASRKKHPVKYSFGRLRLKQKYSNRMSSWENENGEDVIFNPDFWRIYHV